MLIGEFMTNEAVSEELIAESLQEQIEEGSEFLQTHGIKQSIGEIAAFFKAALDARPELLIGPPESKLPDREKEILQSVGVDFERPMTRDFAAETASRFALLAKQSLAASQAAKITGLSPGRIRQLVSSRDIYSFIIGKRRLIPSFQFRESELIPNISVVNKAISPTFHPVGVEQWYHQKNNDLCVDEEMEDLRSPLEWLMEGRNPEPVRFLAENL